MASYERSDEFSGRPVYDSAGVHLGILGAVFLGERDRAEWAVVQLESGSEGERLVPLPGKELVSEKITLHYQAEVVLGAPASDAQAVLGYFRDQGPWPGPTPAPQGPPREWP